MQEKPNQEKKSSKTVEELGKIAERHTQEIIEECNNWHDALIVANQLTFNIQTVCIVTFQEGRVANFAGLIQKPAQANKQQRGAM